MFMILVCQSVDPFTPKVLKTYKDRSKLLDGEEFKPPMFIKTNTLNSAESPRTI